jgi:hypothetical protein
VKAAKRATRLSSRALSHLVFSFSATNDTLPYTPVESQAESLPPSKARNPDRVRNITIFYQFFLKEFPQKWMIDVYTLKLFAS